ncbi:MAG: type II secretion system F family protein, partial [Verrucomicrobiota bacterium]
MLKKVALQNVHSGRDSVAIVDTDSDEKALFGAGKTSVETAKVSDLSGIDETIHRLTSPKNPISDRVAVFSGLARCFERNIPTIKSFQLQAGRVKSPLYRGALANIAEEISKGERISDAMAKQHHLFPNDLVALIRAGEESGRLPEVLKRVANIRI